MKLTIKYFAWVREKVGVGEEQLDVPDDVTTVGDLAAWLATRSEAHANAFARADVIRAACDQTHAPPTAPLANVSEVAFFPPVTGG
ncbi:MAG: molybdopterin converting factor subunit 1 [Pseudomonadota bacterium]